MECSAARDQGEDRKHHAFEERSFFFRSLEVVRNRPCPPTLHVSEDDSVVAFRTGPTDRDALITPTEPPFWRSQFLAFRAASESLSTPTTQVNLASSFNINGIYTNGTKYASDGGLDGSGNSYSATATRRRPGSASSALRPSRACSPASGPIRARRGCRCGRVRTNSTARRLCCTAHRWVRARAGGRAR